jgi:ribose transport system substrate-binding protein
MIAGAQAEAKKYGYSIDVTDSNFDPAKQTSQIEDMITKKVNFILASPGDENALVPAYQAAKKAHIPLMSIGNHIATNQEKSLEFTFYGRRWEEVGALKARMMAQKAGGKGDVIAIRGPSGVAFVTEEKQGYKSALAKFPNMHTVFDQNAKDLTNAEGLRLAQDALTAHPNAVAVWTETDDLAEGVIQALKAQGKAGKVVVVGLDGAPPAMHDIASGDMYATVAIPAYVWGKNAIDIIHTWFTKHKRPPHLVKGQVIVVTKKNVNGLLAQCKKTPKEVWCIK